MAEEKRVNPIILTDPVSGNEYTLEYNRAAIKKAESEGFDINDIAEGRAVMKGISDLFYYAFFMHHRYMTHDKTDDILFDGLGGLPGEMLERLCELYAIPYNTLFATEESEKNSKWTVRL